MTKEQYGEHKENNSLKDMRLLTIAELSELLNVTVKSIYDLVYTKTIPYTKIGNRLRFREDLINTWIESRTHIPIGSRIMYNTPKKVEGEESI